MVWHQYSAGRGFLQGTIRFPPGNNADGHRVREMLEYGVKHELNELIHLRAF